MLPELEHLSKGPIEKTGVRATGTRFGGFGMSKPLAWGRPGGADAPEARGWTPWLWK